MARKSNKKEPSDADRSKEWAIEVTSSVDGQENLAHAIDLILNAAKGGDKSDLGGSESSGATEG